MVRYIPLLATLAFLTSCPRLVAQADLNQHEATKTVFSYLRYSMGQQWDKSAKLIHEDSLSSLLIRYVARVKQAATLDEEIAMVRRLDKVRLEEVEKMDPISFYMAYHKGLQARFEVTEEVLDQIISTMEVQVLSLAEETFGGREMAHVLVRTRHDNRDKQISSLDLVSLIKVGDAWKVTLNAMEPNIRDKAE